MHPLVDLEVPEGAVAVPEHLRGEGFARNSCAD